MGACNTIRDVDFQQRYYFNEINNKSESGLEIAPIKPDNIQMEEVVSLSIEIKNVDISNEHRVELIIKENNKSVGFTEKKVRNTSDNTITFDKFFSIPYYFEKQQLLEFKIYFNNNNTDSELIQTSLGTIMGGRGQTLKKKLSNGEDIYIKGNELKKSSKEIVFDIYLQGDNFSGMKFRYSIINLGTDQKPDNKKLYDSEVKGITKNSFEKNKIVFMSCKIPIMF